MRFIFGAVFGGLIVAFLAMGGISSLWFGLGLPLTTGILGAIFGDPFLVRFMHVFKWIR
jgi:predicted membrane protein